MSTPIRRMEVDAEVLSIGIDRRDSETLLGREWLVTNSRGGFSSGTLIGCNTRRYHGLLVGSLNPPSNRVLALSACREVIAVDGQEAEISNFEFDGLQSLNGLKYLRAFHRDVGVHFEYDLGAAEMTKSIFLLPDSDTAAIVYDFRKVHRPLDFSVRPLVAMRDFHGLQDCRNPLRAVSRGGSWAIRTDAGYTGELVLRCDAMQYRPDGQWWYRFFYRTERQRGQECLEDLWSPGFFQAHIAEPRRIVLWADLSPCAGVDAECEEIEFDLDIALDALEIRERELLGEEPDTDPVWRSLELAAGQFVVERRIQGTLTPTILAGYPWFLDWGRDTFISLPGLLLCTGRYLDAAGVLTTFAQAVDEGMIPNRFDDYGNDPHYNSIDASLWFVYAAFEYLRATGDTVTFSTRLLPAVRWIMESYRKGTRFGIRADADGLITGGDEQTQLTWMDAKCGDVTFTPRYGKAVEINALWHNNLRSLAEYYEGINADETRFYGELADKVGESFRRAFWNPSVGFLNDCILPDGTPDATLRPNQIYALSLPYCPLAANLQQEVLDAVERELLTPYGLRSLSPRDPRYQGLFEGTLFERDRAYHQGTVWSHLMGPFIEAFLRVHGFDRAARLESADFLRPLLEHFTASGCVCSISEIFDGEAPHRPRGCFAQAWSVAELIRAYWLVHRT